MNYFAELGEMLWADYRSVDAMPPLVSTGAFDALDGGHELAFLRAAHRNGYSMPIDQLLDLLGRSARTNLLVTLIMDQRHRTVGPTLAGALRERLLSGGISSARTTALLDLATDQGVAPLTPTEVEKLVRDSADRAVSRAALRCALVLPVDADDEALLGLADSLADDHEILTWLAALGARGHDEATIARRLTGRHADARRFLPWLRRSRTRGMVVLQQVATRGDLDRPGEGEVGGLAVFLCSLGDALARQAGIGRVVTVTQISPRDFTGSRGWPTDDDGGHVVLGLPVLRTDAATAEEPLSEIGWWLRTLLPRLGVVPEVAHVRFGSDVTLAMGRVIRELGSSVAFTIAPDPHRFLLELHRTGTGHLDRAGMSHDLHRLFAAETLGEWADSAIAIPSARQKEETAQAFPNILRRTDHLEAIPEGITSWREAEGDEAAGLRLIETLFEQNGISGLSTQHNRLPILLNVGRWNRMKQQDVLVEAWVRSGVWESTMLVLVGGSLENPTDLEKLMRDRVLELLRTVPDLVRGRFAWLPRLANRDVRLLERALIRHLPAHSQHVYVCSSLKEEFGISVLEAMEAGLLAIAPRRGGASHYIRTGQTGLLADTSSAWGLSVDLRSFLAGGYSAEELKEMAASGQQMVRRDFGIDRSASIFAKHYLQMKKR